DVDGRKFLRRRPGAAQADVAVAVHRQRWHKVVAVRIVNEPLLQQGAVAHLDLVPKNPARRVDRAFRRVAAEYASSTGEDAQGSPPLVGPQRQPRRRLNRLKLPGRAIWSRVRLAQGNRLHLGYARLLA